MAKVVGDVAFLGGDLAKNVCLVVGDFAKAVPFLLRGLVKGFVTFVFGVVFLV